MDSLFPRNDQANEHPQRELLLLFVDGELTTKEALLLESHLEACWPCRVRTQRIQETIADIIEFDETVLTSRLLPPRDWRNFNRRLHQLAATSGNQSLLARFISSLGRFLPAARFVKALDFSALASFWLETPARVTAAVSVAALAIALLLFSRSERTVSASELLRYSSEAEATRLRSTAQPVIHQRLQLRRTTAAKDEVVSWETWNDVSSGRIVEVFTNETGTETETRRNGDGETRSEGDTATRRQGGTERRRLPELVRELQNILAANQMNPQRPLSATSYQSWHRTLQHQRDEVTQGSTVNADTLTLRTVVTEPVKDGAISEALFVLRESDWEPVEMRLKVVATGAPLVFELTASVSEVVSLAQVDPKLFATVELETRNPKRETESPELETRNSKPETAIPAVASADLEVEVLRLLHQAGADLGEQISVKRTAGGPVRVTGIVETDQRKAQIIAALNPIAANPAVQIEIQTVAEAIAKQKSPSSSRPASTEGVEIQSTGIAAEPELRAYFEQRTANTEAAVRQFAAGMVSKSGGAMQHLGAMRRLVNQFSTEQLTNLTPEARASWSSLLRSHARAFQQQSAAMRRDLKPVFFAGAGDDLPGTPAISSDEELRRVVQELFSAGVANDQVIRSAFTVTNQGARFTAIGTPQFWNSLKRAEALAAAISRQ